MKQLKILDTFRIDQTPNKLLKYHIQRSFEALNLLNSSISKHQVIALYQSLLQINSTPLKARLEIHPNNLSNFVFSTSGLDTLPTPYRISFSKITPPKETNVLTHYKTTDRQYWVDSTTLNKTDDVIKVNFEGYICDTSRFNLFILEQNQFYTPSLRSGCLKGCYRQKVLDDRYIMFNSQPISVREKDFLAHEIQKKTIYLGNSLRGLLPAELVIE
jgi:4-amino-4-deoxychorismate lyase